MGLRSFIRDRMKWGPTKPPYRVETFNPAVPNFYISGAACNLGVGIFHDRGVAERMAVACNKIAERYSESRHGSTQRPL